MSSLAGSVANFQHLEELARQKSWIHRLHPLTKLLVTFAILVTVTSFQRDAISGLLPLLFYPVLVFTLADIPARLILKRLMLVEPLIVGIGLLNPILDRQISMIGTLAVSHGWLTLFSIILKSSLTVLAALLLVATTDLSQLAGALRLLRVPRLMVTLLILIYRYLSVLAGETARTLRAYALRAPGHPGVKFAAWGSLAGQLLLRSFDRAERLHQAMQLRGFKGDFQLPAVVRLTWKDAAWLAGWMGFCLLARSLDLPEALGNLLTGVIS